MIESVKAHAPDILPGFGHELEKIPRKSVKVSIDDHAQLQWRTRLFGYFSILQ